MGRYTTVQIFSDSNPSMRTVTYNQAVGADSGNAPAGSAIPAAASSLVAENESKNKHRMSVEKVDNPSGSTAGAGSGEFHVYRASRAREMKRIRQMDMDETERFEEEKFQNLSTENRTSEELKTEKRKRKRQREKEAKLRKKNMKLNGIAVQEIERVTDSTAAVDSDKDEFEYTSTRMKPENGNLSKINEILSHKKLADASNLPMIEIKNDGSFLETMKKALNQGVTAKINSA